MRKLQPGDGFLTFHILLVEYFLEVLFQFLSFLGLKVFVGVCNVYIWVFDVDFAPELGLKESLK